MEKKTLVVNLMAGPGAGKSTMASTIFSELKWRGVESEIVTEFAKDLVWEKRHYTFKNQIYMFGEQHHRIFRLLGQVNVIVVDSPLLLTPIYDTSHNESLETLAVGEHNSVNSYNIFLRRVKDYNPNGRNQTLDQAIEKDEEILRLLNKHNVPFEVVDATRSSAVSIVEKIICIIR